LCELSKTEILIFATIIVATTLCCGGQSEWVKDSKGLPAMTFVVFYQAVFELIGAALSLHHSW
jgi:hypothetical protein